MHPELVDRMMDRRSRILAGIDIKNCQGLEFGPLDKPLVRRDDGEVLYVDYASTEALRVKSSGDAFVNIDAIVGVDHVIDRSDFASTLAPRGPFDYVVASHVFEHIPDPLTWLEQLRAVLRPGGRICLAVPDRRHTFDFYRRETTVGDLLAFRLERLVRPSLVQLCDHYLHVAVVDTGASWQVDCSQREPSLYHPWSQVELILNQHLAGRYIDCHCTVWTHYSFERVIPSALERAGIHGLRLSTVQAPIPDTNEFIVQLLAV